MSGTQTEAEAELEHLRHWVKCLDMKRLKYEIREQACLHDVQRLASMGQYSEEMSAKLRDAETQNGKKKAKADEYNTKKRELDAAEERVAQELRAAPGRVSAPDPCLEGKG